MKPLSTAFILLAATGLCLPAHAASPQPDSTYTALNGPDCKTLSSNADQGSATGRCPGVGGYKLDWQEGDLRQSITVIDPNGREFPLELWSTVASGFSSLGDKAEWRVKKDGKKTTPLALIVRYNVSEDPDKPEKTTSYLTVSKITSNEVCVTDVVKPGKDANQQARDLADVAADKPCTGSGSDTADTPASTTLTGKITGYECGDNCYLTIKDAAGEEHSGLCTASLCDPWNEVTEMPSSFIGKQVTIKVGTGKQYDGAGNVMGEMDSFDDIELLDGSAGTGQKQTKSSPVSSRFLCAADEQVVFGCNSKSKMISLCASPNVSAGKGYLQYRFGTPDKIELAYPEQQEPPQGNFWHSFEPYSGGYSERVRFENSKVQYVVFEDMISTGPSSPDKEMHQGVGILMPGKQATTRLCDGSGSLGDGETTQGFVFDHASMDIGELMDKEDFNFDIELHK